MQTQFEQAGLDDGEFDEEHGQPAWKWERAVKLACARFENPDTTSTRGPDRIHLLLNRIEWDADEVMDDVRDYVVEHLGDRDAVLIVDDTGFLKKGIRSASVQRQYSGTAGRTENRPRRTTWPVRPSAR